MQEGGVTGEEMILILKGFFLCLKLEYTHVTLEREMLRVDAVMVFSFFSAFFGMVRLFCPSATPPPNPADTNHCHHKTQTALTCTFYRWSGQVGTDKTEILNETFSSYLCSYFKTKHEPALFFMPSTFLTVCFLKKNPQPSSPSLFLSLPLPLLLSIPSVLSD